VRDFDLFIIKNCQEAFSLSTASLSNVILFHNLMLIICQTSRFLLIDSKQRRRRLFLIVFLRFKYVSVLEGESNKFRLLSVVAWDKNSKKMRFLDNFYYRFGVSQMRFE